MRIIFDSEAEKNEFMECLEQNGIDCPSDIGFHDSCYCGEGNVSCNDCWKNAIPYEIKE